MASKDIEKDIKSTKKLKKEQAKVEKVKRKKVKPNKGRKKLDTVVFVETEEQAKEVFNEVMKGPIVDEDKKKTSNFWSELKSFFLIILFVGVVVGLGFIIFNYVKPLESKKNNKTEETKVMETSNYKTVSYKPSEGNRLRVINDTYLIEYKEDTLYKILDMDGNELFSGTESFSDIFIGIDDELYLTIGNSDSESASVGVYKFINKELVEVFTASDKNYLFTTLIYVNDNTNYLMGVVGETLLNGENIKIESLLYTLDGDKHEFKDVRLHGENSSRLVVDEPIFTYSKDYVVVKDTHNEYKFGIYDIKNSEIVLNTKYDGLYTTSSGDYIAIKGKKAGIVNIKSKILVDFKYDFIYDANGFYVVSKDKKLGLIDNNFVEIIKPKFTFQQVGNAGFNYYLCCGAINSFAAYRYKDKYVLTVNNDEMNYDLEYKVHETYVIDSKGEFLTIDSNELGIYGDFIYSYDKEAKKYIIYDENFAEKYTIDISEYDFEDGPYISLVNENTIVVSLDTELYYDYSTGSEIESLKDAMFTIDKIEFKYTSAEKSVFLKVNGELIGTYEYYPKDNYDNFYYNVDDKMYYYVTDDIYVMVRKSE